MLKVAARISADDFLLPELCPEAAMAWRNFMAGPKKEADRSRMNPYTCFGVLVFLL